MTEPLGVIRLDPWFQGPTDSGQGGWTAHRLQQIIGEPVSIAIKAPIPLDEDLVVTDAGDGSWRLDPTSPGPTVMTATPGRPDVPETEAVAIADAAIAGMKFPLFDAEDHPVPHCFSCGLQPDSMQVHSGPLPDGRWATDWTVPWWAGRHDDDIDEGALWAAIDCAQAWYVGNASGRRTGVTVQLSVEMHYPLVAGASYALVAWPGDYDDDWDGRKRGACGAVFDHVGRRVASSRSFWVAIDE